MGSSLKQIDFVLKLAFSKMTMLLSAQASKWAAQTTFISTHAEKKIRGNIAPHMFCLVAQVLALIRLLAGYCLKIYLLPKMHFVGLRGGGLCPSTLPSQRVVYSLLLCTSTQPFISPG